VLGLLTDAVWSGFMEEEGPLGMGAAGFLRVATGRWPG